MKSKEVRQFIELENGERKYLPDANSYSGRTYEVQIRFDTTESNRKPIERIVYKNTDILNNEKGKDIELRFYWSHDKKGKWPLNYEI